MQCLVACSKDGFAFGNLDKTVLKQYKYLHREDCVPFRLVREKIDDPKYGHRYRLLYDGITTIASDLGHKLEDILDHYIALVMIPKGPLFANVAESYRDGDLRENGSIHLQFYVPCTIGQSHSVSIRI